MNEKKIPVGLIVILFLVALIAVFCYTQLEIVPSTRWVAPAREIRANPLYALEEWLKAAGCSVRTLLTGNTSDLLNVPEKIIFIEASCFNWDNNDEQVISWLEEGRQLIISLDSNTQYQLDDFMESLGIAVYDYFYDEHEEETGTLFIIEEEQDKESNEANQNEEPPSFDTEIYFVKADPEIPLKYKAQVINSYGKTRLIKFKIGNGSLIFMGEPNFLTTNALRNKPNRDLAAEIFLSDSSINNSYNRGILFFRTLDNERHLIGNLAERGNPAALFISLGLLVIAGFWMTIPVFGRYKPAPEKPGKPLRERFLAEGRFIKKNHALGKYIAAYEREIEQREKSGGIIPITNTAENNLLNISFEHFLREQKELMEKLEKLHKEKI